MDKLHLQTSLVIIVVNRKIRSKLVGLCMKQQRVMLSRHWVFECTAQGRFLAADNKWAGLRLQVKIPPSKLSSLKMLIERSSEDKKILEEHLAKQGGRGLESVFRELEKEVSLQIVKCCLM